MKYKIKSLIIKIKSLYKYTISYHNHEILCACKRCRRHKGTRLRMLVTYTTPIEILSSGQYASITTSSVQYYKLKSYLVGRKIKFKYELISVLSDND